MEIRRFIINLTNVCIQTKPIYIYISDPTKYQINQVNHF